METKAIEASNTTFLFGAKFSADASYVIAGDGRYVVCMLFWHNIYQTIKHNQGLVVHIFFKQSEFPLNLKNLEYDSTPIKILKFLIFNINPGKWYET